MVVLVFFYKTPLGISACPPLHRTYSKLQDTKPVKFRTGVVWLMTPCCSLPHYKQGIKIQKTRSMELHLGNLKFQSYLNLWW